MSKQMNIRISDVHLDLLEKTVETLIENGTETNKTDVIQKAIYSFAVDYILEDEVVSDIMDRHFK